IRMLIEIGRTFILRLWSVALLFFFVRVLIGDGGEQKNFRALATLGDLQRPLFGASGNRVGTDDLAGPLRKLPSRAGDRATNLIENLLEIEGAEVTTQNQQNKDEF